MMSASSPVWKPAYQLTASMARALMEISSARAVVEHLPIPAAIREELRRKARVRSTHFSTRIEGNRLTLAEAEQAIVANRAPFHGRERDVVEVRNYWNALLRVEEWAASGRPLTEDLIHRLHALIERGPKARPSVWRDGQNSIRDSESGAIVYLPPEAKDVAALIGGLIEWVKKAEAELLPVPIVAGLAHYQFVTIHPYYDGNGRTARLLATFLLHRGGHGLQGLFSLEEHHARDLAVYYRSLAVHPHHNYNEGREEADLTPWLEYFLETLAAVFASAKEEALRAAEVGVATEPDALRLLDPRARVVLGLFGRMEQITARDVASALGLSDRMARVLIRGWVGEGLLQVADPSRRSRSYTLSAIYRQSIGNREERSRSGLLRICCDGAHVLSDPVSLFVCIWH